MGITSKKLEEECSKYGSIISCVVKIDDESSKPLGYGYVQFETPNNADDCVSAMNNVQFGEKISQYLTSYQKTKDKTHMPNQIYTSKISQPPGKGKNWKTLSSRHSRSMVLSAHTESLKIKTLKKNTVLSHSRNKKVLRKLWPNLTTSKLKELMTVFTSPTPRTKLPEEEPSNPNT